MATGDLKDQLQAALGGTYTLERELGRGGMATVYLAVDLKHKRRVALKVLHPDLAAALGPERFRREIELAAQLQHPHILSVHDSGETPTGQLWFTMPYIEGESLRGRLKRERQLPLGVALRIAREVADALDYAHEHGVVHRDIKPENILLTRSHAMVADFGIARALNPHTGEHALTGTGMSLGTPGYMSPEQAAGETVLDARTDIYSLGAVLYEMLAGEPPFTGPTAQAVVAKMLASEPPPVRRARPSAPEAVDTAIRKALAPVPADRFATAAQFGSVLEAAERTATGSTLATPAASRPGRRFPTGAALLGLGFLVGVGVLFAWRSRGGGGPTGATGPVRIAVLPFDNLGDSSDAYFADGLTDAVRNKLAALSGLEVIASTSSGQYRHSTKGPQEIGRELGVRYLLVGKVRWVKDGGTAHQSRVQVSPELIETTSAADKWGAPFDAAITDVFQVQADIAGQVAQQLRVALTPASQQVITQRPTENLAAYDLFLKGEEVGQSVSINDPVALTQAVAFYQQAVALDSGFAPAWAQLGHAEAVLFSQGNAASQRVELAREAIDHARALSPTSTQTLLAQGSYDRSVLHDNSKALAEFTAGLKVAPHNAELLSAAAISEESFGRWEAAVAHFRQAEALDPRSVATARGLEEAYQWLRRYPDALAGCDRALALSPGDVSAFQDKAMIKLAQGDLAGARALIATPPPSIDSATLVAFMGTYYDLYWLLDDSQQRLLASLPVAPFGGDPSTRAVVLAQVYAFLGNPVKSRRYADSAQLLYAASLRATPQDAQTRVERGIALVYLGRRDEAIREGELAVHQLGMSADAHSGPYIQHQLVRIYLLAGEPEKALDQLEPLLKVPYFLSPAWLKIDPNFAPLHGNPRFERLVAGS